MQQHNEFSFALNGPVLDVHKVENFEGLMAGPYCRILIALNGLWYAELQSETDQNHDDYFIKTLDAAKILVCATVYECVELTDVDISSQIGQHCAIVTSSGIYTRSITGGLFPMQISGAMYAPPQPANWTPPITHGQAFAQHFGGYRPALTPTYYPAKYGQQVIVPGINHLGIFTDRGGFLHWLVAERGHVTPMPVINPTLSFDDRMELEKVFREMIRAMGAHMPYPDPVGFTTRPDVFTSDDPEQHRFDMSSSQRDQQEIG